MPKDEGELLRVVLEQLHQPAVDEHVAWKLVGHERVDMIVVDDHKSPLPLHRALLRLHALRRLLLGPSGRRLVGHCVRQLGSLCVERLSRCHDELGAEPLHELRVGISGGQ